jgi:hypothetical protein
VTHFRSPELLRLAAGHECTLRIEGVCQRGPCVSAHSNQSIHGKGRGIKAHDCFIAWGCAPCHAELDQGKNLTRAQKIEVWNRGHIETLPLLMLEALGEKTARKPRAEAARPTSTLPRQREGDVLPKIVPRRC